jgi:hypothetical protein
MTESTKGAGGLSADSLIAGVQGLSGFTEAFATFQLERDGAGAEPEPDVALPAEAASPPEEIPPVEIPPVEPEPEPETTASAEPASEPEEASFTEPEPEPEPVSEEKLEPPAPTSRVTTPIFDQLLEEIFPQPGKEVVTDQPEEFINETTTIEEEVADQPTGDTAKHTSSAPRRSLDWPTEEPPPLEEAPAVSQEQAAAEPVVPPVANFSSSSPRRRVRAWPHLNISRVLRFVIVMLILDYHSKARRS